MFYRSWKGCSEIVRAAVISECYLKFIGKDKRASVIQRLLGNRLSWTYRKCYFRGASEKKSGLSWRLLLSFCQYCESESCHKTTFNVNRHWWMFNCKRKQGRPSKATNNDTTQTETLATQSQNDSYNKSACAIC